MTCVSPVWDPESLWGPVLSIMLTAAGGDIWILVHSSAPVSKHLTRELQTRLSKRSLNFPRYLCIGLCLRSAVFLYLSLLMERLIWSYRTITGQTGWVRAPSLSSVPCFHPWRSCSSSSLFLAKFKLDPNWFILFGFPFFFFTLSSPVIRTCLTLTWLLAYIYSSFFYK